MKEMKNIKVSFDFDSTLDRGDVQMLAMWLVHQGIEVWIVTSRISDDDAAFKGWTHNWNGDLWTVADQVGIKKENTHFTAYANKSEFLDGKGFLFHLDDDDIELEFISELDDDIIPIHVEKDDWFNKIKELIK